MPAENSSEPLTGDEQQTPTQKVETSDSSLTDPSGDGYDPFADLTLEDSFPEADPSVRSLVLPEPVLRPQPTPEEPETAETAPAEESPAAAPASDLATSLEEDNLQPAVGEEPEAPASLEEVNLTALDLPWLTAEMVEKPQWQEFAENSGGFAIIAVILLGAAGLLGVLYAFGSAVAGGVFGG